MHRSVYVGFECDPIIINVREALFIFGDDFIGAKGLSIHGNDLFETHT